MGFCKECFITTNSWHRICRCTEIFKRPYVIQAKNDEPEQYKAIGFAKGGTLVSLIVEVRKDDQGEYDWFVTLWKATKDEVKVYEQSN